MKKSTLIISIAILGVFITLTAGNLKLKNEYEKGILVSNHITIKLKPFRFIKEKLDTKRFNGSDFMVTMDQQKETGLSMSQFDKDLFFFNVSDDTLFIKSNPAGKENRKVYGFDIRINSGKLTGISACNGSFIIEKLEIDSFSVIARESATINLNSKKINRLFILGGGTASISLYSLSAGRHATSSIENATIQMMGYSNFSAENIIIRQKKLMFDSGSSVKLTGTSIADFGIIKQ